MIFGCWSVWTCDGVRVGYSCTCRRGVHLFTYTCIGVQRTTTAVLIRVPVANTYAPVVANSTNMSWYHTYHMYVARSTYRSTVVFREITSSFLVHSIIYVLLRKLSYCRLCYISTNSLTTAVVTMLDDGIFKFSTTMQEWFEMMDCNSSWPRLGDVTST